jgi:dihydrofolate synthase/folylpolyglutamate synthase
VALARALVHAAGRGLPDAAIAEGLSTVRWPGRLERLAPDLMLDCAHNEEGARALARTLPPAPGRVLVASLVRDKDVEAVLTALRPAFAQVVATQSRNPRALPAAALAERAAGVFGPDVVQAVPEAVVALEAARRVAGPGGVVVAGSVFLVGELRAHLLGEPVDPLVGGDPL